MSSATSHRLAPSMATTARATTRFGDFSPGSGRNTEDERSSQGSAIGQSFGNGSGSTWKATSGIWGTSLGGAFAKRDNSRSRVEDEPYLESKPSGSSALADTSEADPWLNRANGPWNPETTSPTMSMSHASGSASPIRHRGSNQATTPQTLSELHNTSPYFSRPHAIGQGSSYTGKSQPQTQSALDPTSGSFKNQMPMFGSLDDKENMTYNSAYELDNSARGLKMDPRSVQSAAYLNINGGGTSRDSSMPPSRQSEAASVASTNSAYGLSSQFSALGHTTNNSLHFQRPSFSSQTSSQSLRNAHSDIAPQTQDIDLGTNFARLSVGDRDMANNQAFQNTTTNDFQYEPMQNINKQNGSGQVQCNGAAPAWQTDPNNIRNIGTFTPSGYSEVPFAHQFTNYREQRYNDGDSISPANSDVRRGPSSPHFYNTPPTLDQHRPSSRGLRQHASSASAELPTKLQRIQLSQQFFPQSSLYDNQFAQYAYDNYNHGGYRPLPTPFGYQAMGQYSHAPTAPKAHTRDHDAGHGVRSLLLEEFRSNSKTNKRYELKDIYHHVVEFSGDQHGSRFIQQKLETANSDEKEQIFSEIQPNALQLMTDVFGNYVVQKIFEHGNQVQKRVLAEKMKNHVSELSSQTYGCRVVQKALEHVLADQQAELVRELQPDILKCVKDQNGNHVIQKAIERVPTEHIQFIIEAFKGQVHTLATHPYGCRVIQRMLEFCSDKDQASVLEELHQCAAMLITDQYGNYVTQHVISSGKPEDRSKIIKIVISQVVALSKHKFASNVVEKSIQYGTDEERRAIVANLTTIGGDGIVPVQLLMKDQYGNYVIQKLLLQLQGADHTAFIEALKPQLIALKKYNYGKQISAIEKHVFLNSTTNQFSSSLQTPSGPSSTAAQPLNIPTTSTTPTPVLTMETSSIQSSSLPSVEGSTVDGPVHDSASDTAVSEKAVPEVKIEGV